MKAKYGKANLMKLLAELQRGKPLPISTVMIPISQGEGSRYGEDVIRITGSDEFCQAVLSRLADMIEIERSNATRLDAGWSEVKGDKFAKGQGGNAIYLRMACRGQTNSPMAMAHAMTRQEF